MAMSSVKFRTVDEYLSACPGRKRNLLEELRKTIRKAAPEAEEIISYNMPAYKVHGMLVYFAAHKGHIGFYPGNTVVNEVFKDKLKMYKTLKGTIQLPYERPIPVKLITKIVQYRLKEILEKAKAKSKK